MDEFLDSVRKPARYVGREVNAFLKNWEDAEVRVCLVFPDLYELGMSHLGLHILYLLLNQQEGLLADRAYAPARDLEERLRANGKPLRSWESRRPLKDFDIVGISYPYELCATNILNILDLSQIPLWAAERGEDMPLILGGGSAVGNPEPVADFYDALIIGEAEEMIQQVVRLVRSWKEARGTKEELLLALTKLPGVYVPQFFRPRYRGQHFEALEPLLPGYEKIKRLIIADLDQVPYPWRPLVPWTEITHDRLALEISRGCTRGCRFCQASSLYRPVRERSVERLLKMAEEGLCSTGWDEVSFLSLSAGDYSCLSELLVAFNKRFLPQKIALSLPSLRVGTLSQTILEEIKRVRKTGFTIAPEAGTERLRRVINKDITEKDLFQDALRLFEAGWCQFKLYFMMGLPTETEEDLWGIVDLVRRLTRIKGRVGPQVTVSISTFVPKPHTAFQWESQLGLEQTRARQRWFQRRLRFKRVRFKWHKPEQSFLEGVFSRGDRRIGLLAYHAFKQGARLDGWSDELRFNLWLEAAKALGLDLNYYLRERRTEEPLPWDHIDLGIKKDFLLQERHRAYQAELSKDCRFEKCVGCGVCDFKEIKNTFAIIGKVPEGVSKTEVPEGSFWYRVYYKKVDWARHLSQLDLMRAFHRALRRAGLPVAFSEGFHPLARVSFPRALPVGVESLGEILALELIKKLPAEEVKTRLARELPEALGVIKVLSCLPEEALMVPEEVTYAIELKEAVSPTQVDTFLAQKGIRLKVRRGAKIKEIDLRPFVLGLELSKKGLLLRLFEPPQGGVRAKEVVAALFGVSPEEAPVLRIIKLPPEGEKL